MAIIGFNITKILAQKKSNQQGKINVNNNVAINNVGISPLKLDPGKISLSFQFQFTSKYDPDIALISIEGEVLTLEEKEVGNKILEDWKKTKRLGKEVATPILNNILSKCNIQAIILSRDVNLPPPVPLPKIEPKDTDKQ
ncbi:hypothetical protein CMO92_01045 [Candidatus Woesearchaeota archaeon]|nr:hypothetical protein [Candidatus Woesearchaeota archaeon]|tara:strand:+ start:3356 stop:3775 length:420 start_codon:yes stop_codon:yes gene_type:complete